MNSYSTEVSRLNDALVIAESKAATSAIALADSDKRAEDLNLESAERLSDARKEISDKSAETRMAVVALNKSKESHSSELAGRDQKIADLEEK